MCGISGELRFNTLQSDISAVASISHSQSRRGMDGEGLVSFDNITLGHRRLKIFDLSDKGQQPMFDPTLGLAITFNGAIYNYRELRDELMQKGYTFFSVSDTEVLLKAYHCWKLDMLSKIQGIFAFAIWERDKRKLVLVRDRMGVKPLYYLHSPSAFRFASTLPALLTPDVERFIDPDALHYYFMFHIVPEPLTLIEGIHKLEPATVMTVYSDGSIVKHPYWQLHFYSEQENETLTENEWTEWLEEALVHSIKSRMVADVPVGVLLSGGLDSSMLVALMATISNSPPLTFSIGFESTPEEQGDEFHYSDIVARHFSTDHTKIFIKGEELNESLTECVQAMSEPLVSHDAIGFYLLSREVKKHVTVVQSGQGADELFAGYRWFQNMDYYNIFTRLAAEDVCDLIADNSYREYFHIVTPPYRTSNLANSYLNKLCRQNGSSYMLDLLQRYEAGCALSCGPLARVDNMTMAWSLEAREPFLDPEVVKIACRMPASLKLKSGGKYALKKLAGALLPDAIVNRPKGYFPVPKLKQPESGMVNWLREVLSEDNVRRRGLFSPSYVRQLFGAPGQYVTPLGGSKLWQIGLLEFWMQSHHIH